MEIERIAPVPAIEQALAAWAAAIQAAPHDPSIPVSEPALPGADSDAGHEAATVQTAWRAPAHASDAPRGGPALPPAAPAEHGDRAASAPLMPALLCGLSTEPATHWPLPHPAAPERAWALREHSAGPATAPDTDADADWCDALSAALRALLITRHAPEALLIAAEQWRRGRCVVLACPQGSDAAGPAWAFVLRARPSTLDDADEALALSGLRVEARLHWRTLPPVTPWCHVRRVKEHHRLGGRQLVAPELDAVQAAAALPCEVQLGPLLGRALHPCEVRVHIQAAQAFWGALGRQWGVQVVVSARPLLAARPSSTEAG